MMAWLMGRVRSFLGLDWLHEAREIADEAREERRRNFFEEELLHQQIQQERRDRK